MAFVTPRTWVTGETVTAAELNEQIRDNMNFLHGAHTCRVWNTANQSIPDTTDRALTFDSESFDTDGFHDLTTNTARLTVPTGLDGYYLIEGSIVFAPNATGFRDAKLRLNGGTIIHSGRQNNPGGGSSAKVLTVTTYRLIATDYVELIANQTSGSPLNAVGGDIDQDQLSLIYLGL